MTVNHQHAESVLCDCGFSRCPGWQARIVPAGRTWLLRRQRWYLTITYGPSILGEFGGPRVVGTREKAAEVARRIIEQQRAARRHRQAHTLVIDVQGEHFDGSPDAR